MFIQSILRLFQLFAKYNKNQTTGAKCGEWLACDDETYQRSKTRSSIESCVRIGSSVFSPTTTKTMTKMTQTFWIIVDKTKTKTKIKTRYESEIEINGILVLMT